MNRKQKKQKQYSKRAIAKFNALCGRELGVNGGQHLSPEFYTYIIMNKLSIKERKIVLEKYLFNDKVYQLVEKEKISRAFEKEVLL